MKLREKNLTYFALILFFSFATIYLLLSSTMVVSFSKLEEKEANQDLDRITAFVDKKIDALDLVVRDWAFWDGSYNFVLDRTESYLSSNLQDITLRNNRFHLLVYLDDNSNMVWGTYYDVDNDSYLPISPQLLEEILGHEKLIQTDAQGYTKGFLIINSCPKLISSRPILPSSTVGPSIGTLIVGRIFCQEEIQEIINTSYLPLTFHPREELYTLSYLLPKAGDTLLYATSEELLKGFIHLKDINGDSFGLLEVEIERSIYQQGITTLRYLLTTLLMFTLLVVGISWHFLQNSIISRLELLNKFIQRIDLTGSPQVRLAIEGIDEIEELKNTVNNMLDQLEATQRDVLIAQDQLVASLSEKEMLLKEIHHRVKNNLQVVSSLLRLQNSFVQNEGFDALLKDCQNRIQVMSLIHENLYRSVNIGQIEVKQYINQLVKNVVNSYAIKAHQVNFILDIEELSLDIDTMVNCGLIINELMSNSLKYAFPKGEGTITLSFKELVDQRLQLIVADDGVGIPREKDLHSSETLGFQLVSLLASQQLGGTIALERDKGTKFIISFSV